MIARCCFGLIAWCVVLVLDWWFDICGCYLFSWGFGVLLVGWSSLVAAWVVLGFIAVVCYFRLWGCAVDAVVVGWLVACVYFGGLILFVVLFGWLGIALRVETAGCLMVRVRLSCDSGCLLNYAVCLVLRCDYLCVVVLTFVLICLCSGCLGCWACLVLVVCCG